MSPPPPSPPASPTLVGVSTKPSTKPDLQCWECQRRGWTCDAARPVCNKCRTAGIVCPGYGDSKPLIWLAPGKVTSRNRKQRGGTSLQTLPSPKPDTQETAEIKKKANRETKRSPAANSRKKSPATSTEAGDKAMSVMLQRISQSITPPVLNSRNSVINREWCELTEIADYCK